MSSIDPEIKPVIDELNKTGLKTTDSCAGHSRLNHPQSIEIITYSLKGSNKWSQAYSIQYMGHIVFVPSTYNSTIAKKIMKKHGLTGLKEFRFHNKHTPRIGVIFNPIGVKYTPRRGIGVIWDVD